MGGLPSCGDLSAPHEVLLALVLEEQALLVPLSVVVRGVQQLQREQARQSVPAAVDLVVLQGLLDRADHVLAHVREPHQLPHQVGLGLDRVLHFRLSCISGIQYTIGYTCI